MDFNLNEDQIAFADSAKALFADFCAPEQQAAYEATDAGYMQNLWQQCVDNGLTAIILPEAAGGLEQGMTELMAVLVEQGRALAQVPLAQQQLAASAIAQFANAATQAATEGKMLTLGVDAVSLKLAGDKATGVAGAVPFADSADAALLLAQDGAQTRVVLVD